MHILDCTIRDGSYATHNHWDPSVLKLIVSSLANAGMEYIEVGNSLGLGTWRKYSDAVHDEDHFKHCIPYKGNSKIGSFFLPYVAKQEDMDRFRDWGADFVRVGANATEINSTFKSIQYAKSIGFFVCCNLMKTYALSRFQLVQIAQGIVDSGADCVYVVDSAGGMLPDQVKGYVEAIKEFYDIKVGFHGHNNLLLANANSLSALQAGADFVDATLRGIGRGAGNAQLESLIAICQKSHLMKDDCNVLELADLAEKAVGGMMLKGSTKREINEGTVNFHDSYTGILEKVASEYNVDPDLLISEVSKINVINPSEELFEFAAKRLKEGKKFKFVPTYSHKNY